MKRIEFPVAVQEAAWERAGGFCECGCGRRFGNHPKHRPEYDHRTPASLGGDASLENCRVLRVDCHRAKTSNVDSPMIAKARRGERERRGIVRRKRKIPGSKGSGYRKPINGPARFVPGDWK